jgi:D-apiose dehydrogenase
MNDLRFALFGAGFWARYQLAAWQELPGAQCVAVCDPVPEKAAELADRFGISVACADPQAVYDQHRPDFVDIVASPSAHGELVRQALARGVPAICQKPLAPTLDEARELAAAAEAAGVPLLVHENWRWQTPLRAVKQVLDSGVIGSVFRGRIQYSNSFPVFDAQPFLRTLEQFLLTDIGTHILDVARFLFGEMERLFCVTTRVQADLRGEDVATVLLRTRSGAAVTCEMSYASRLEHDRFPETFVLIEGDRGSVELGPDYWVRVTTADGTQSRHCPPPRYPWADPRFEVVQSSLVPCLANLLSALREEGVAETTATDNLRTLALVFGAYRSAATGQVVELGVTP